MTLDGYLQWVQSLPPVHVDTLDGAGEVQPYLTLQPSVVAEALVIDETALGQSVETVAVHLEFWGRVEALTRRVWQVREREYRVWRSRFFLSAVERPADAEGWKKPTEKAIEASYRVHPTYAELQHRIEAAEEAHAAAKAMLDAFRAKRDMLKTYSRKPIDLDHRLGY